MEMYAPVTGGAGDKKEALKLEASKKIQTGNLFMLGVMLRM